MASHAEINKYQKTHILLIGLLPLVILLIFGMFGSNYSDQGFVRGFSWRMSLGEIPYKDFIYPRPPMTIVLDWLFRILSPMSLEVFLERARYYYQVAFTVLLVLFRQPFIKKDQLLYFFIIAYLLTLGCFPPMSWYTIDGVFFGALSYFFFAGDKKYFGWALGFAFCSALSKQSFYPLVLFMLGYWAINLKRIAFFKSLAGFLPAILLVGFLLLTNSTMFFLKQTSGASNLKDLIHSGFEVYLNSTTAKYIIFIFITYFLYRKNRMFGITFIGLVLGFDFIKYNWMTFHSAETVPFKDWPRAIFVLVLALNFLSYKKIYFFEHSYLLAIAWCASLSWGYQTPVLFMVGLLVPLVQQISERVTDLKIPRVLLIGVSSVVVLFVVQNLNRYSDGKIWANTKHLGSLNSKYTLIFTNEYNFGIYEEVMRKHEADRGSLFLPAFSDTSYFLNQKPFLPLDWTSDIEIREEKTRFLNKLNSLSGPIYLYRKDYEPERYLILGQYLESKDCVPAESFFVCKKR